MANLIVQNRDGTVTGANGYVTVEQFYAYHAARNSILPNDITPTAVTPDLQAASDDKVAGAIVRGTEYIDIRFQFIGWRRYSDQTTEWPRWDAIDITDRFLRAIPQPVMDATCDYAFVALTAVLAPTPTYDARGRRVLSFTQKVGPIENSATYSDSAFEMPIYPLADNKLKRWGLTISGMRVQRT